MPDQKTSAPSPLHIRLAQRALLFFHLITRPMTLGVRAIVVDDQDRLFLVRHSYVPGWHLPGGGVEAGETTADALARELEEEANLIVAGPVSLQGVYLNRAVSRRDHVAVYVVRDFTSKGPRVPDWEIVESGFFPLDALPEGTTRATRARLEEWRGTAPMSPVW